MRILYRARQFWQALRAAPQADELAHIREILSPPLMALFEQMHPSEQAHSLRLMHQLTQQGYMQPDLLVAALLHDVGKSRHPIHILDRVWIVLGKAFFPKQINSWGRGTPRGWRRPFVVAENHAAWGAEMAAQAGASPLAIHLIQRHQEQANSFQPHTDEDHLLHHLQLFDDQN